VASLRGAGLRAVGAAAGASTPYTEADLDGDVALVLGGEAHGLASSVTAALDAVVAIPMRGGVESLNVGVAGSLLAYEWARRQQR
jgi:tRNA G18 (ribose-2'-O)-methylase SpoU